MDNVLRSLSHFGGLIRGHPPVLSPTLDEFELMQYIRRPLKPATDEFRILFNVSFFQPHEIEITVSKEGLLEIRASHGRRQNPEGLWMTRDCSYSYELPPEVCARDLHAQWSEDNYLLVQATSSKADETDDNLETIRLVPKRVRSMLKPTVEMKIVREMVEEIRDKALYTLRYIRFHTYDVPCPVEKQSSESSAAEPTNEAGGSFAKE